MSRPFLMTRGRAVAINTAGFLLSLLIAWWTIYYLEQNQEGWQGQGSKAFGVLAAFITLWWVRCLWYILRRTPLEKILDKVLETDMK